MKTPDIARAAEQLLAGAGWLPAMLRTSQPEGEQRAAVETEMVVLQELAVLRQSCVAGALSRCWIAGRHANPARSRAARSRDSFVRVAQRIVSPRAC